jgi:transposase
MEQSTVCLLPVIASGGNDMVKADVWHEIHSRFKLKETKKAIARCVGLSVQTVRKILRQAEPQPYRRLRTAAAILVPFEGYIRQRVAAVGYCARSVFEEIQTQGYPGGYDAVKRFVRPLRKEAVREATVRFETPPGRQAQADWGHCWTVVGGKRVKIHLFVMTLGYSRRMFAVGARDEKLATFIRCHEEAFDHLGGVAHEILYDNPKTVVLSRDFEGRHIQWNATFWDFSRYYGFRPWAHRPYRAQTKGKVESGIKYVKRFLRGKAFDSPDHLNTSLLTWITTVADQRIHGTTHRRPADLFAEEKDLLIAHQGKPPYQIQERAIRHVSRDCMVTFETNRYSVPFRLVGRPVEVQSEGDEIHIYHDGYLIVSHLRLTGTYENRVERAHYAGIFTRDEIPPAPPTLLLSGIREDEVEVRALSFYESLLEGGAL